METVVLGRTGLEVSVAGLGCGGHSRLGQRQGASVEDSVRLVRAALDLGITYIDTAQSYGTEAIVGRALEGRRSAAVVSTKVEPRPEGSETLLDAAGLRRALEGSLERLGTDAVDVYHLHGVLPKDYHYCVEELVPELLSLRDEGLIGHLALSERFNEDTDHDTLRRAAADDVWEVVMVGFNILNPSARRDVLPHTMQADIGVEVMFAVRSAFSRPDNLRALVADAVERGLVDGSGLDLADPLGFLVREGGASSLVEAAYRFARHEPGCHVVLTGTGNLAHLEANVASINLPPLPEGDLARLRQLFGHLSHISGN